MMHQILYHICFKPSFLSSVYFDCRLVDPLRSPQKHRDSSGASRKTATSHCQCHKTSMKFCIIIAAVDV